MNRRGVALVVVVVLAIGFGAWWLSALPVEVTPAADPPAPVVERVEAPVPSPPPAPEPLASDVPASSPAQIDAGVMAELEVEVVQGGKQLIGVRVELQGPGGRVSRPTDVMGYARFTLPVGDWRITNPDLPMRMIPYDGGSRTDYWAAMERLNTVPLKVTAPLTRFRMELPQEWLLRGRVVDSRLQPAPGATVSWPSPLRGTEEILSGPSGEFTIKTQEPSLQVQAKRGLARSMLRTAGPGEPITLVLEEWTHLEVQVTSAVKPETIPRVRVLHRNEIVAVGLSDDALAVPVGHLSILARARIFGRMHSGKVEFDARSVGENLVQIELKPTPPISGVLVDAAGHPMPGLAVAILEVEPTTVMLRGDGGIGAQLASVTTRTNDRGEFSWQPRVVSSPDPLYQVAVVELWQARADPVLVRLDDAPLSIVVEPATPR